jgi:dienelactone hydrolase
LEWKTALLRALIFMCGLAAGNAAATGDAAFGYTGARLIEEQVRIPVRGGAYSIAATILRPAGAGPYGVIVLNHGVPVSESERARTSAAHFRASAPVFARHGYVVVMPMRRGFGATGGAFAEDAGPCSNPDFVRGEQAAADDVMAAYDYARLLPYVDPSRMILAGQSAGGVVSMYAAATRAPKGLVAVLSFAGGRGGNPLRSPGLPCAAEPLAQVFEAIGKSVRAPVLFYYAENDQYFGPKVTRHWYERFTAGGARAQFVVRPSFGTDGHFTFVAPQGVQHWLPEVERFLEANGVPFEPLEVAQPAHTPRLQAAGL